MHTFVMMGYVIHHNNDIYDVEGKVTIRHLESGNELKVPLGVLLDFVSTRVIDRKISELENHPDWISVFGLKQPDKTS